MTPTTQHRQRLIAALLCALLMLVGQPALAQETGALQITRGAGTGFDPARDTAVFQARRIEGLGTTDAAEIGKLSVENPRLLTDDPGHPLGAPVEASSDAGGVAVLRNLPAGVYQVREVSTHTGNDYRLQSTPFLMYVAPGATTLVEPKPDPLFALKEVDPAAAGPGQDVTFHVTTNVAPTDVNGDLHQFVVADELDPRLAFSGISSVVIRSLRGVIRLSEGGDYTVINSKGFVGIYLTQQGLRTLADASANHPETRVELDIRTSVKKGADRSTPVYNTVGYAPDGHGLPYDGRLLAAMLAQFGGEVDADGVLVLPDGMKLLTNKAAILPAEMSEAVTLLLSDKPTGSSSSDAGWGLAGLLGLLGLCGGLLGSLGKKPESPGLTPVPSTPAPATPGQPGQPGQPAPSTSAPAEGGQEGSKPGRGGLSGLASTGASVLGVIALGLLLVLLGVLLLRRRRDREDGDPRG